MNLRPPTTIALATATLLVSGGIAYAAVQSVAAQPDPQVVVPTSAASTMHRHGADDPARHHATDDGGHGGARGGHGADDPATHDVNDDNGGHHGGHGGHHGGHGADD